MTLRELPPELSDGEKEAVREKALRPCGEGPLAHMSDEWLACQVRMLMRDYLYHEAICVASRDRIMALSVRVAELEARVKRQAALIDEQKAELHRRNSPAGRVTVDG